MAKPTDLVHGTLDLLILKDPRAPAHARLGHRATHPSGFKRSFAGTSRRTLSRAASPPGNRAGFAQNGANRQTIAALNFIR